MIKRIVFLGAPSTGKSTLCEALAKSLNTAYVPEYGREYWLEHQVDRRLTPEQLLHIAETQNKWEDRLCRKANDYLLCDTNAFTTWHFALHYHQQPLPELTNLAQQCWDRYSLVVLCDTDIPYDDTWERSGDTNRQEFQTFVKDYLESHGIIYHLVSGGLEHRVRTVMSYLNVGVTQTI
jgi:NadR type nicotinamide-nucleotide adenylyltransferase